MTTIALRDAFTDAIRYWERGRILYNVVLAGIVLGYFLAYLPASGSRVNWELGEGIFLLAVLANVAYCAAYVPDMVAQLSDIRPVWLRFRWVLLVIGVAFAGVITQFIARGMFANAWASLN